MKKALICTVYVGFIKGFLLNDIKILQSLGYEVHCAASDIQEPADFLTAAGAVFHNISFSSNKPISRESLCSYFELKKLLRDEGFDFVHIHTPIPGVICRIAAMKYRRKGTKIIYTTHGFYFHKGSSFKTKLVYRTIESLMSYLCDAIITINKEDYNAAMHMHCRRVYHIPGVGVKLEKYRDVTADRNAVRRSLGIDEKAFVILAIGEISDRKNHILVLQAMEKCRLPEAVFLICGDASREGNIREELVKYAEDNNLKLVLAGFREDIPVICKCADIGTMSSKREGLGLSGIEMIASGLPIVATGVHGITDYVKNGENGYLASTDDADSFAEGIMKLYDAETRKRLSANCIDSVEPFSENNSHKAMEQIYREVLQ